MFVFVKCHQNGII